MTLPLIPLFYVSTLAVTDGEVGTIATVQSFALLAGYLLWTRLWRRRGGRVILLICGLGVAAYPLTLAVSRDFTLVLLITAAASLFQAGLQLVLFDELMKRVPVAYSPTFVAVEANVGHVAGLGGPLLGAALGVVVGLPLALALSAAISLVGYALLALDSRRCDGPTHRTRHPRRGGGGGMTVQPHVLAPTDPIRTVRGPIHPDELGRTSIHEHLLTILDHVAFRPVDTDEGRAFADAQVSLETRWWVRQQWVSVRDNLRLTDEVTATAEVARFARVGGGAIADPTTDGIGRDPHALARISEATRVHVVMGAGYYVHGSHPDWIEGASEPAIAERIVADLMHGAWPGTRTSAITSPGSGAGSSGRSAARGR